MVSSHCTGDCMGRWILFHAVSRVILHISFEDSKSFPQTALYGGGFLGARLIVKGPESNL